MLVPQVPAKHHAMLLTPPLLPMLHAQYLLAGLDGGGDGGDGSHLPPGSPPTGKSACITYDALLIGHGQ